MTKTCAIIGCSPVCFPWGFDEEDESCAALKLILINQITRLRGEGCMRFAVSIDCGVGLYAAEIIHGLFNALAACMEVVNAAYEKTVGCKFKAYLEAINEADTVIVVYDPDDPRCEREAAAVAVAEMLNRQVFTIDPKAIHLF